MLTRVGVPVEYEAELSAPDPQPYTLLCFSHLRWNFVFQRPQHLMSRFAREMDVIYWEEPVEIGSRETAYLQVREAKDAPNVRIVVPHLPQNMPEDAREAALKRLLDAHVSSTRGGLIAWYYTPMMLPFSRELEPSVTVYDAMDELSKFKFVPTQLLDLEDELLKRADIVFTGGSSLYEAKKGRHSNIHCFPSSVDRVHFLKARARQFDPADQEDLPKPRLGFYGVIDEQFDTELLDKVAEMRPEWSFVMVGPVVKISEEDLPKRPNIDYLGGKTYAELPAYLSGWDVAMMPFAMNESTQFISPTKTPEYLAGGKPVVSTPIKDVVRHYGHLEGVKIASTLEEFVAACEDALELSRQSGGAWLAEADLMLSATSWDTTQARMAGLVADLLGTRAATGSPGAARGRRMNALIGAPRAGKPYDYLIVGAGYAGSVLAERLASQHGARVLLIDRRPHVGGNAYDEPNEDGILYHKYGPHIFHTNSQQVVDYLSQFTDWRPYEHRVLAQVRGQKVPIPINRTTLNMLFDAKLKSDEDAAEFLASRAEPVENIQTSEDVVINAVGRELYELFFRGYTRKQWGLDPSELDKQVTSRIPTRTNTDDRYFADTFQAMPRDGYTAMFEKMLDNPLIEKRVDTDFRDLKGEADEIANHIIYSGPIDEYFDFRFGKLPYRSLRFDHQTVGEEWHQPVAVVNYPAEDVPYTRITEYKHLTGQEHPRTTITYEYPSADGDPYYPVPRDENQALYKKYEAIADATSGVTFVGRLATYRYYNMDQIVGQALATFRRIDEKKRLGKTQETALAAE